MRDDDIALRQTGRPWVGDANQVGGYPLFDVCGPLPSGTTVLQASAGTGKTFTIAALAARYVAGGLPLQRLLLVTFTRMATGELRQRVRDRLVTAESGLRRILAGGPGDGGRPGGGPGDGGRPGGGPGDGAGPGGDDVLAFLARGSRPEMALSQRRLAAALADFDSATISTTHEFCQHVLSGLGVAGDCERDVSFLEDTGDLVAEVVDDLYVRRFLGEANGPRFGRQVAMDIAKAAVDNPLAAVEPAAAPKGSDPAMRQRLAMAVRREVEERKARMRVVTYDDSLIGLARSLRDPVRGPAVRDRLGQRYQVVLVDEFQDTDPIQWEIMRNAFGGEGSTLVLIGDPKQAIYSFRGADVFSYLDAAREAGTRATLGINWRSDQGLIDAYDALLGGIKLGHPDIGYLRVRAATANRRSRLRADPCPASLRVRIAHRGDGRVTLTEGGLAQRQASLAHVAGDLAQDIVALLSSNTEVVTGSDDGSGPERHAVAPGDLAVLVRNHRDAARVRQALEDVGVPAVIYGAGNVFETEMAREWLVLLEGLERPASPTRAHAVAASLFVGWRAEQVAMAEDGAWETVFSRLHRWAAVLRRRGVASLAESVTASEGLPGRLLARAGGERQMTDLHHVGQLLHLEQASGQLGVTALVAWLRQRIAGAAQDTASEDRSRRLESDAEAVQVLTIHRSKGLEFPIVYLPYLWEPGWISKDAIPIFHDPPAGNQRTIDVGGAGPGFARHWEQFVEEQRGEDLRLAYVALTRARHQSVIWWVSASDSHHSPLGRLLFRCDDDGNVAPGGGRVPDEAKVVARFQELAGAAPGCISVERVEPRRAKARRWDRATAGPETLTVCGFDRSLDTWWQRTSYSAITSGAHPGAGITSEPEAAGLADEMDVDLPPGPAVDDELGLRGVASKLAAMPAGAAVGSLVHAVLERVDFASADLDGELAELIGQQSAVTNTDLGERAAAVAGLRAAIETPLGVVFGARSLRHFGRADRLNELDFELPLVGGDLPRGSLSLGSVAGLLAERLPPGDAWAGYPARMADPALQAHLRGYLAGSIDLVLRVRDGEDSHRFVVVDYKTNWLGVGGEPLSAWHYRPAALTQAMVRAHYPLQALLYTVALHRFLRWRLAGYDPARHLGGVAYLFLRGMTGQTGPEVDGQPCGVFSWSPPAGMIAALSDLLDQGAPA